MNYKTITLFILLLLPLCAFSQYFEVGLLGGVSNYLGDLSNNSKRLFLKESHLAGGLFVGYNRNENLSFKLGGLYTNLSGTDANAPKIEVRKRNLSFASMIIEGSLRAEWNIGGFNPYNNTDMFAPFIYGGIAGSYYDPTTEYLGSRVALRDIGTEGQGISGRPAKYGIIAFSIPFGAGVKYAMSENWTLGFELGARLTFTDYLDDVGGTYMNYDDLLKENGILAANLSNRTGELTGHPPVLVPTGTPRGDNNPHDWYFIAGLTISYNFMDNGLMGSRKKRRHRRSGCPVD